MQEPRVGGGFKNRYILTQKHGKAERILAVSTLCDYTLKQLNDLRADA